MPTNNHHKDILVSNQNITVIDYVAPSTPEERYRMMARRFGKSSQAEREFLDALRDRPIGGTIVMMQVGMRRPFIFKKLHNNRYRLTNQFDNGSEIYERETD